ncbi:hypothetical protein BUE93_06590 [Chromobacterium amazonense]|uniref:Uncharacterized protein n=1 Tax=Chromobacterium amazonense TaxID=1382803 RepID=A0A2S9X6Z3_9NEIS|nr:hypothetical protein BUE93_06590 [Chromobacterium amazonense]
MNHSLQNQLGDILLLIPMCQLIMIMPNKMKRKDASVIVNACNSLYKLLFHNNYSVFIDNNEIMN